MLSGDFRNTGRDDIVTFYKIPIADLLSERTRIYMCLSPSMYGYNKVWNPTDQKNINRKRGTIYVPLFYYV